MSAPPGARLALCAGSDVVIVLNWFGRENTLECVASLRSGSPEAVLLVIDNGSYDDTLAAVAQRWPEVHVLQLATNLGFAGGMNAGLRWAVERGAATITVLNNDTVLPAGAISSLADRVRGADLAVSPRICRRGAPEQVWFAGGALAPRTGLPYHLAASELPASHGLTESAILAGCCVTASRATWERVGYFDEWFFLTFEDSEWSLRARRTGATLAVDQGVVIEHAVSASFVGAAADLGAFYYARNGLRFVRRDAGGSWATTARFFREHVLPQARRRWAAGARQEALTYAVLLAWASAAFVTNQGGPAPRPLQWLVHRRRPVHPPTSGDLAQSS